MPTTSIAIGLAIFVVVILAAAFFIQRLDTAIAGDEPQATTDSPEPDTKVAPAQSRPVSAPKHRRHGR